MKKILTITILISCFYSSFSQSNYRVAKFDGINIYNEPNINSIKIGKLPFKYSINHFEILNDTLTTHEKGITTHGNWLKIKNSDYANLLDFNKVGYIYDGYLQEVFDTKNDLSKLMLYGKVKSIDNISYHAIEKDGRIYKGMKGEDVYHSGSSDIYKTFNKLGLITTQFKYDDNGKRYLDKTKKYDKKGNIIETNSYLNYGNNCCIYDKVTYKYNRKNSLIRQKDFDYQKEDTTLYVKSDFIYKYNIKGNQIKIKGKYFDGSKNKWITNYYKNGCKKETKFYKGNKLDVIFKFNYDKNWNLTKKIRYDIDKQLTSTIEEYEYNIAGEKVMETFYNDPIFELPGKTVIIIDINNNTTSEYRYSKNKTEPDSYVTWIYNANGKLIERHQVSPNTDYNDIDTWKYDYKSKKVEHIDYSKNPAKIHKYTYQLDYRNNWIKRIHFEDGIPTFIIKRTIKYYN